MIHRTQIIFLQVNHQKICRFEITRKFNYKIDTKGVKNAMSKKTNIRTNYAFKNHSIPLIPEKIFLFLKIISFLLIIHV